MQRVGGCFELLDDISKTGIGAMSHHETIVWLADRIAARLQFDYVEIGYAPITSDQTRPEPEARTHIADSTGFSGQTAAGLYSFFGRRVGLADLRELTWERVDGPKQDERRQLGDNQSALLVRIREAWGVTWVLMVTDSTRLDDEVNQSDLANTAARIVRLAMGMSDPPLSDSVSGRRQAFYRNVLDLKQSDDLWDNLREICKAWGDVSNASWVWLWLYNPLNRKFELSASLTREENLPIIERNLHPDRHSACDYCARTMQPEFIEDATTWKKRFDDEQYTVSCAQLLKEVGAVVFDAVPLLPSPGPAAIDDPDNPIVAGVITLHYRSREQRRPQPRSSLLLMGRMSALRAQIARMERNTRVLDALNNLAQKHLVKVHRKQSEVRREYLNDVIELLKQHVNVRSVSIFFKKDNDDAVECIATTGLWDSENDRFVGSEDRLSDVMYRAGENWTGTCFARAEPIIRLAESRPEGDGPKYADVVNGKSVTTGMILQYPIPLDESHALGVIRCSGHRSPIHEDEDRGFDTMDVKLVGFVARQLAPILQTIAGRIKREREISIVKHDLYTPLNMFRDILARVEKRWRDRKDVRDYDIRNLMFCERTASNLVDRLSVDLSRPPEVNSEPTRLGGHIIARLKNMMSDYAQMENNMEIRYGAIDEWIPTLHIDRELIERAIYNLIVNAVKYGAPHTTIDITAKASDAGFYLDISNYGIGIQDDEAPHLFKPEYRSPRVHDFGHGVGLGLTIARQAVEAHGGTLKVTSLREPTTFTIFLPRSLTTRKTT